MKIKTVEKTTVFFHAPVTNMRPDFPSDLGRFFWPDVVKYGHTT